MIYISGPISGTDNYMERFAAAEEELKDLGYTDDEIINPARVNAQLPKTVCWGDYMQISLCMLGLCDEIYMLNGWGSSQGGLYEYLVATSRNLRVILQEEVSEDEKL